MTSEIRIVFMRHGRSLADDEHVIEGRYDALLTDVGRDQARRRGDELAKENVAFDALIASPLKRAAETAQIVGGALGLNVEFDADWMEKDNGPVAGLPYDVARAKYPVPDFHNPFEPHVVSANAGESTWAFQSRAARALESVIRRGPGHYLVVAHGGILNAALRCIVGAQPPVTGQGIYFGFGDLGCAKTRFEPGKNRWVLQALIPGF